MKCQRTMPIPLCDNRVLKTLKQHSEFDPIYPLRMKYFNDSIYNYPMNSTPKGEKRIPDEDGFIRFAPLEFHNRGSRVPTIPNQSWMVGWVVNEN